MDEDRTKHRMTATEVRGGQKVKMTRYVLSFGLVLVIIAFIVAFFIGAY